MSNTGDGTSESRIQQIGRRILLMAAWGFLGAVCSEGLGLFLVTVHAPEADPSDSLANEWYGPMILFLLLLQLLGGFVIGALLGLGFRRSQTTRIAFASPLCGALLAIGVTWIIRGAFIDPYEGSLILGLTGEGLGAILGFMLALPRSKPHWFASAVPRVEGSADVGPRAGEPDA